MAMIRIDDQFELAYEESGTGRPIVFIHGVWMSARFFHKQVPALGRNHHAIALDLRGHGGSSHTPDGHTMATYAQNRARFSQGQEPQRRGAGRLVDGLNGGVGLFQAVRR